MRHANVDPEEEPSDEDDERPTLEEQRSLLSLAAEHDGVDVIQELLRDATLHETLLAGAHGSDSGGDDGTNLHAAAAHGSTNTASCLLRMGPIPAFDPRCRPRTCPGAAGRRGGASSQLRMEEDRNYRKYHGMST